MKIYAREDVRGDSVGVDEGGKKLKVCSLLCTYDDEKGKF
jgi:hypothetical protein